MKDEESEKSSQECGSDYTDDMGVDEHEQWATETVSFINRDSEDTVDWLEPFAAEAPSLYVNFSSPTTGQTVNLTKERFVERFSWCLEKLNMMPLPVELVDELFNLAIGHCQQATAYREYQKTLTSAEFNDTLDFIRREQKRMKMMAMLLDAPPLSKVPRQMTEWENVWVGSLRELVRRITPQLDRVENGMSSEQGWLKAGRTQLESHLLLLALDNIRKILKREQLRLSSIPLLVAYGHASQLAKYCGTEDDGDPIEAMKVRMSRARRSNKRTSILCLFLAQGIKKQ